MRGTELSEKQLRAADSYIAKLTALAKEFSDTGDLLRYEKTVLREENTHLQALLDSQNASNERLDAECHRLRGEVERLTKTNSLLQECQANHNWWVDRATELETENTRLKAPVSDEEAHNFGTLTQGGFVFQDDDVDRLFASRAAIKEGQ